MERFDETHTNTSETMQRSQIRAAGIFERNR